jgi:hypothetical protein
MNIPASQIQQFLVRRGWHQLESQQLKNIVIFSNPAFRGRQLVLPNKANAADYEEALDLLLQKLADIESRSLDSIHNELERAQGDSAPEGSDAFSLRVLKAFNDDESIPLVLAKTTLTEVENLLAIGARQAEAPSAFYKRTDTKLSNDIRNQTVFNHTKRGSFVLTVSCPVVAPNEQLVIDVESKVSTNTRRAFLAISRGLTAVTGAIESHNVEQFAEAILSSELPVVSSNFCTALANLAANDTGEGISLGFEWSKLIPTPADISEGENILLTPAMADQFNYISRKLRPDETVLDDAFVGTVEALSGDVLPDGRRAGRVEFSIFLKDGSTVRASASLNPEQYKEADEAHIAGKKYVRISGTLEERARIWIFTQVKSFELVS